MDHSQEFDLAVRARTSRKAERAIRLPELLRTPPCSSSLPRRKPSLAAPLNIPLISPQTPPAPARCPGSTGLSSLLLRDVSVKEGAPLWSLGGPPQPLQSGLWVAQSVLCASASLSSWNTGLWLFPGSLCSPRSAILSIPVSNRPPPRGRPGAAPRLTSQYRGPSCTRPPDPHGGGSCSVESSHPPPQPRAASRERPEREVRRLKEVFVGLVSKLIPTWPGRRQQPEQTVPGRNIPPPPGTPAPSLHLFISRH